MLVQELFKESDDVRVIARAIFEDECKEEDIDGWITKYYAQLVMLKNSDILLIDAEVGFVSFMKERKLHSGRVDVIKLTEEYMWENEVT